MYGVKPVYCLAALTSQLAVRATQCVENSPSTRPPITPLYFTLGVIFSCIRNQVDFKLLYFLNVSQSMSYRDVFIMAM